MQILSVIVQCLLHSLLDSLIHFVYLDLHSFPELVDIFGYFGLNADTEVLKLIVLELPLLFIPLMHTAARSRGHRIC